MKFNYKKHVSLSMIDNTTNLCVISVSFAIYNRREKKAAFATFMR